MKAYRTIILTVVMYECETLSLTLREKCRLRVFENRVLRRIFGPKRDGVIGERRSAHSVLVGKPEGRRLLERPRRRWEDNIKMNF
jgi:hypothetical protein